MFNIGDKLDKHNYTKGAIWCNENNAVINPDTGIIEAIPAPTLKEVKDQKRAEINAARDQAEQGGFEYMGKVFDSDQVSAQRISMAAQAMALAPDGTTITWTCQDNSTIDLTAQELVGLVVALAQHSNTCHEKATALKAKIEEAKSEEELNKINWCEKNQIIPIACCRKLNK